MYEGEKRKPDRSSRYSNSTLEEAIMRNFIIRTIVAVAAVASFGAAAHAQTSYRAQIPFDFDARGKNFKAGDYAVARTSSHSSASGIVLRSRETGKSNLLGIGDTSQASRREKGKLVFVKVAGRYQLTEIATPGFGMKVRNPRRAEMIAAAGTAEDIVIVTLD
jgi:hypothetical protein